MTRTRDSRLGDSPIDVGGALHCCGIPNGTARRTTTQVLLGNFPQPRVCLPTAAPKSCANPRRKTGNFSPLPMQPAMGPLAPLPGLTDCSISSFPRMDNSLQPPYRNEGGIQMKLANLLIA